MWNTEKGTEENKRVKYTKIHLCDIRVKLDIGHNVPRR